MTEAQAWKNANWVHSDAVLAIPPDAQIYRVDAARYAFGDSGGLRTAATRGLEIGIGATPAAYAPGAGAGMNVTFRAQDSVAGTAGSFIFIPGAGAGSGVVENNMVGLGKGAQYTANSDDGTSKQLVFQTAGSSRWLFRSTGTAETGGNAGSNFRIMSRTDAGAALDTVMEITRSSGNTLFGAGTVANPHSGTNSERWGLSASSTGVDSTAVGNAASANFLESVAVGRSATITGNRAVAIGFEADAALNCTSIGRKAGMSTTSSNSVYIGFEAGANSTGNRNVFIGIEASDAACTGADNTSIGYRAVKIITSGLDNSGFGARCGATLTTGAGNVFIGTDADVSNPGDANSTVIGRDTIGTTQSISIGSGAISTTTDSIAIGFGADTDGANCIVFGSGALGNLDGDIVFGSSSQTLRRLYLGNGVDSTAPVNAALKATSAITTANTSGGDMRFVPGKSTGSAIAGAVVLVFSLNTAAASTQNAELDLLKITGVAAPAAYVDGSVSGDGPAVYFRAGDGGGAAGAGSDAIWQMSAGVGVGREGQFNIEDAGGTTLVEVNTASEAMKITGKLTVTGLIDPTGMVFDEQTTVPGGAPGAAKGTLWVRDDAPNVLVFTDDTGADTVLGAGGGGSPGGADTQVQFNDGGSFGGNSGFTFVKSSGSVALTQPVSTSGSPTLFTATGAAHTTLTASTEATDINFDLARTVQFATGALTTQRAVRVQAPTYGFVGASTITTAATVEISGAPVAGTNATITNRYALLVESGEVRFKGKLTVDGSLDPTDVILSGGGTAHFMEYGNGTTAAVAAAGLGRIRYNDTAKKFQVSVDTGGYTTFGGVAGTTNTLAKFDSATTVGDSGITDDGTIVTVVGEEFSVPGTGTSNELFGAGAGNSLVAGANSNTMVGKDAGTAIAITGASFNVIIGEGAAKTSDRLNVGTIIGHEALRDFNLTGTNHKIVAIGAGALKVATGGIENVAVGTNAMGSAVANGGLCTAVGEEAMISTTGVNNTAMGHNVAPTLTTGTANVIIGAAADVAVAGTSASVVIGAAAAQAAVNGVTIGNGAATGVTGTDNTVIGQAAGTTLTSGTANVIIGKDADASATGTGLGVAIGSLAQVGTSCVAIGYQASPVVTGVSNTVVGKSAALLLSTGTSNVIVGETTGQAVTTGTTNVIIGANADGDADLIDAVVIGSTASSTFDECIVLGANAASTAANQLVIGSVTREITEAYIGEGVVAASPGNVLISGTGGSGTDNAGATVTLASGRGTGSALAGDVIISASNPGATGTTLRTLVEIARFVPQNTETISATTDACAGFQSRMVVERNTAVAAGPRAILVTESGRVFTNEGASAENHYDLPTAAPGLTYTFVVVDTDGIQVNAATGDTLRIAGSVSASAGDIAAATIGDTVTILAVNTTEWIAIAVNGSWTVT